MTRVNRQLLSRRSPVFIAQVLIAIGLVAIWQLASSRGAGLPSVRAIASAFLKESTSSVIWMSIGQTMWSWLIGLVISVAVGVALGILISLSDFAYRSSQFILDFMRSVPTIALLPVALLIYGTRIQMKLLLIVLGCTWIMVIQTAYGIRDVDPVAKQTLRSFRLRSRETFFLLTLPSAAPYIASGLRVAATLALLITIGSEMVTSAPGLGSELLRAGAGGATSDLYALVLVAAILGFIVLSVLTVLERTVIKWRPSSREGVS